MKPRAEYIKNCFTTGVVGYEGVTHIKNDDWSSIINQAKEMKGFKDEKHC